MIKNLTIWTGSGKHKLKIFSEYSNQFFSKTLSQHRVDTNPWSHRRRFRSVSDSDLAIGPETATCVSGGGRPINSGRPDQTLRLTRPGGRSVFSRAGRRSTADWNESGRLAWPGPGDGALIEPFLFHVEISLSLQSTCEPEAGKKTNRITPGGHWSVATWEPGGVAR